MAHKKAGGSSRNGRDSNSQRLGLKIFGGEQVLAGNIIARQRGTKWHPGTNVGLGKDHTLFALTNGRVEFRTKAKGRVFVSVAPDDGGSGRINGRSNLRSAGIHRTGGPTGYPRGETGCRLPSSLLRSPCDDTCSNRTAPESLRKRTHSGPRDRAARSCARRASKTPATIAALVNDRRIAENTLRIPHPYGLADAQALSSPAANASGGEIVFLITTRGRRRARRLRNRRARRRGTPRSAIGSAFHSGARATPPKPRAP